VLLTGGHQGFSPGRRELLPYTCALLAHSPCGQGSNWWSCHISGLPVNRSPECQTLPAPTLEITTLDIALPPASAAPFDWADDAKSLPTQQAATPIPLPRVLGGHGGVVVYRARFNTQPALRGFLGPGSNPSTSDFELTLGAELLFSAVIVRKYGCPPLNNQNLGLYCEFWSSSHDTPFSVMICV
jgi:hypothetical protein